MSTKTVTKTKSKVGRPLKFNSPEEMDQEVTSMSPVIEPSLSMAATEPKNKEFSLTTARGSWYQHQPPFFLRVIMGSFPGRSAAEAGIAPKENINSMTENMNCLYRILDYLQYRQTGQSSIVNRHVPPL